MKNNPFENFDKQALYDTLVDWGFVHFRITPDVWFNGQNRKFYEVDNAGVYYTIREVERPQ